MYSIPRTWQYHYVRLIPSFKVISEDADLGKTGFSSCSIDVGDGKLMRCLSVYHPSMPSFGCYSEATQSIIARFLAKAE